MENQKLLKALIGQMIDSLDSIQDPAKKVEASRQAFESVVQYISIYGKEDVVANEESEEAQEVEKAKAKETTSKSNKGKGKGKNAAAVAPSNPPEEENEAPEDEDLSTPQTDNVAYVTEDGKLEYVEGFAESSNIGEEHLAWFKMVVEAVIEQQGLDILNSHISQMSSEMFNSIEELNEKMVTIFISYLAKMLG